MSAAGRGQTVPGHPPPRGPQSPVRGPRAPGSRSSQPASSWPQCSQSRGQGRPSAPAPSRWRCLLSPRGTEKGPQVGRPCSVTPPSPDAGFYRARRKDTPRAAVKTFILQPLHLHFWADTQTHRAELSLGQPSARTRRRAGTGQSRAGSTGPSRPHTAHRPWSRHRRLRTLGHWFSQGWKTGLRVSEREGFPPPPRRHTGTGTHRPDDRHGGPWGRAPCPAGHPLPAPTRQETEAVWEPPFIVPATSPPHPQQPSQGCVTHTRTHAHTHPPLPTPAARTTPTALVRAVKQWLSPTLQEEVTSGTTGHMGRPGPHVHGSELTEEGDRSPAATGPLEGPLPHPAHPSREPGAGELGVSPDCRWAPRRAGPHAGASGGEGGRGRPPASRGPTGQAAPAVTGKGPAPSGSI